jgi:hypothetical protein
LIYVKRDPALIPEKLLKVAERAQAKLAELPAAERVAFIKKKSHIWRAFKRYLRQMSYGKCWYSEAMAPQSPYDVDHFRPKSEARRSEILIDDGYPWLAFDWDNFRYSAELCNRPSKDEESGETVGKGSWFPLVEGSPIACWDDRCTKDERPLLLDPTRRSDVALIDVASDGLMKPVLTCVGTGKLRVKTSIRCYGLNLPNLWEARKGAMDQVTERAETLLKSIEAANTHEPAADAIPIEEQREALIKLALPRSPFSLAARAKLIELGLAALLPGPEEPTDLAA